MNAGIYVRVSTDKELQESSIENQELACVDFCKKNNFNITNVYKDIFTATKSGKYNKRNGYKNLINDALSGKIDLIVAKDLSRISRNPLELQLLKEGILSRRFNLITFNDDVNSILGNISLIDTYIFLYSQESRLTSIRTKMGKETVAKNGRFIGSIPPYGYELKNKTLVIRNDNSPSIVEKIFNDYIHGKSAQTIANELSRNGIPTPSSLAGKKNSVSIWSESSVRGILKNQSYTGDLVQGKTEAINTFQKNRIIKKPEEHIIVPNNHKAIISKDKFNLVQDIFKSRQPKNKVAKNTHILSNLIFCKTCGKAMSLVNGKYICSTRKKKGFASCSTAKVEKLTLVSSLTKLIIDKINELDDTFLIKYVSERFKKNLKEVKSSSKHLNSKKDVLISKRKNAVHLLLDNTISKSEYEELIQSFNAEIDIISNKINSMQYMIDYQDKINLYRDFYFIKSQILKSLSLTSEILRYFIQRINISPSGKPEIYFRF